MAAGGMVYEPSYIVPVRTGAPAAVMAERGPEAIGPVGGGPIFHITVQAGLGADQQLLRDRGLWERIWDTQLRPLGRGRGVW
jgi:hypothetical protein